MNNHEFIVFYNNLSNKEQNDILHSILNNKIKTKEISIEDIQQLFEHNKTQKEKNYEQLITKLQSEYDELENCAFQLGQGKYEPYYFDNSEIVSLIEDISNNGDLTIEIICEIEEYCENIMDLYHSLLSDNYHDEDIEGIIEVKELIKKS